MKTKFTINQEIFLYTDTLEKAYERYNECYKESGWILDKEGESVFIIFDKEINLNVGERVDLEGYRIVTWKCVNVLEGYIEYEIEEERG